MSVWNSDDAVLDDAIRQLRSTEDEQLSPKAKAFIVDEALAARTVRTPWGIRQVVRMALVVGAVPVVLGAVVLIAIGPGSQPDGADWARVEKRGNEVVFTIADGDGPHRVLASTDPQGFEHAREMVTGGKEFQVDAAQEPKLVFYKID